jgi:predicted RNA-binding Zn-ribbon protein involved in translation (DUF1610 family)
MSIVVCTECKWEILTRAREEIQCPKCGGDMISARKAEREEAARKKAEEQLRKKAKKEEASRKKVEEIMQRLAEKEAARKRCPLCGKPAAHSNVPCYSCKFNDALEDLVASKKAEEEAAQKKAEEEAARKKAEEEAARKKAEEVGRCSKCGVRSMDVANCLFCRILKARKKTEEEAALNKTEECSVHSSEGWLSEGSQEEAVGGSSKDKREEVQKKEKKRPLITLKQKKKAKKEAARKKAAEEAQKQAWEVEDFLQG